MDDHTQMLAVSVTVMLAMLTGLVAVVFVGEPAERPGQVATTVEPTVFYGEGVSAQSSTDDPDAVTTTTISEDGATIVTSTSSSSASTSTTIEGDSGMDDMSSEEQDTTATGDEEATVVNEVVEEESSDTSEGVLVPYVDDGSNEPDPTVTGAARAMSRALQERQQEKTSTQATVAPNQAAPRVLKEESATAEAAPEAGNTTAETERQTQTNSAAQQAKNTEEEQRTTEKREKLREVGGSVRELDREAKKIENRVTEATQAFANDAARESVKAYSREEREKRLEALQEKINEKRNATKEKIRTVVAESVRGEKELAALESVLRSSAEELEALIESETGRSVDLVTRTREISDTLVENAEAFAKQRERLIEREGLALYRDTDQDGVSDYDEVHIYETNPKNAYTAGGVLTDGERILLGLDPLSDSPEQVAVESPVEFGVKVEGLFEVRAITLKKAKRPRVAEEAVGSEEAATSEEEEVTLVEFAGKALPNSFVTLYIFSTPIVVTVKTGQDGQWTYTLERELEDGEHELYVATVNNAGKILAKSDAIPFVKRAEAIDFTPPSQPAAVNQTSPLDILKENMFAVSLLVLVVFAFIVLVSIGLYRQRTQLS